MLHDAAGFTSGDVKLLQEAHQRGVAQRGWGRAQFASNEFSHYLAIWDNAAADPASPTRVIVRFLKTGTYALLVRNKIVANGATLRAILPALAVAGSTPEGE
jgi:hypothetical protein